MCYLNRNPPPNNKEYDPLAPFGTTGVTKLTNVKGANDKARKMQQEKTLANIHGKAEEALANRNSLSTNDTYQS